MWHKKINFMSKIKRSIIFSILFLFLLIFSFGILIIFEENIGKLKIVIYILIAFLSVMIVLGHLVLFNVISSLYKQIFEEIKKIGVLSEKNTKSQKAKNVIPEINEISDIFKTINHLFHLMENINNNYNFIEMIQFINKTFSEFIPYNYIGVALIDDNKKMIKASYGVSDGTITGLPDGLIGMSILLKETSLNELISTGEVRIINDLEEYTKGRPLKSYNKIILNAGIKASITLPLRIANKPVGVIFFSSKQRNVYEESHIRFLKILVNSIAVSFNQNIFINDLIYSNTLALAKLAEARDEETGEHLDRMKEYSVIITEMLYREGVYKEEIDLEYLEKIERFSPLHDIGKVGVPDAILLKKGKLTVEEFDEMKKHTIYGAEVLRTADETIGKHKKSLFGMGIDIAEGHQEKWNGSGYPYGRKGVEIPLSARIVAVADVFDALTSKRPYKEAFSFTESFNIIEEGSGNHFDPQIITCLEKHKDQLFKVYEKYHLT